METIYLPVGRDQPVEGMPHHGEEEAGVKGREDVRWRSGGENIRQPDPDKKLVLYCVMPNILYL